jgi:hypothetical protein
MGTKIERKGKGKGKKRHMRGKRNESAWGAT